MNLALKKLYQYIVAILAFKKSKIAVPDNILKLALLEYIKNSINPCHLRKSFCRHQQYSFCNHYQHKFPLLFQDSVQLCSLLRLYCNQRGPSALFLQELYLKQKKSLTSKLLKIILKLYFFLKRYFLKKPLKSRVLKYLTHYQRHIFLVTNFMYCINRTFTQTIHILDKCDGCEDDKC